MFGYIRPQKPELLVKEFEQYRGIYCGLCRQLGKSFGWFSRFTLSFDSTFFAMVLMGLGNSCPGFERRRCVMNPLKKCNYCTMGGNELELAGALSVFMTYHKLRDDIEDSGFGKKLLCRLLLPFASHMRKKARRNYSELEQAVSRMMEEQRRVEHEAEPCLDACAEPTAFMLAFVFPYAIRSMGNMDKGLERLAHQFGYYLGRWVYLIDAADDMEQDAKTESFNPFNIKHGLDKTVSGQQFEEAKKEANQSLNLTLFQIKSAMDLMEFHCFDPIIRNVVLLGLPQMQKEILFTKKEKKNVRSL